MVVTNTSYGGWVRARNMTCGYRQRNSKTVRHSMSGNDSALGVSDFFSNHRTVTFPTGFFMHLVHSAFVQFFLGFRLFFFVFVLRT